MKIESLDLYPTQLVHVETIRMAAEKRRETVNREFDVVASTQGEILDERTGKSHIHIKVSNDDFYIEEEKVGTFRFEEGITDEKSAIQFMELQGVRILWSYIREDLYAITSKMLETPVMLPTIDVMRTVKKAK